MEGENLTSKASTLQSRFDRHSWWLVPVLLGALFFVYGLFQIGNYGVTWDEPLHRNWGKIFMVFWKTGDRSLLDLMPGHGIDYGPIYYALNYQLSQWLYGLRALRFVAANHVLNLFTASIAVGLTAVLGSMMSGQKRIGILAAVLLMLYPQFIAHAHYNPKDIPLMTAVLLTSIAFIAALRSGKPWRFALAAFLMGVGVALKVSALLMAPVFGLAYTYWLMKDERSMHLRNVASQLYLFFPSALVLGLGTYIFWPDAWGDPLLIPKAIHFFTSASYWPGKVLYFGAEYGGADLPWHYTPFEYFAATPAFILVALGFGAFGFMRRFVSRRISSEQAFLALWIAIPLLYTLKPGLVRYDGIRQFFFVLPPILVVAAIVVSELFDALRTRFGTTAVAIGVLLLSVSLLHEVRVAHPFEGSYRNEVIRMAYPQGMDHVFEIEYWGPSYLQGMQWLIEHADPNPVICVPTAGVLIEWYPWRSDFTFECSKRATYVMFFTRYSEAGEFAKLREPVFTIRRMGAELLQIYKIQ